MHCYPLAVFLCSTILTAALCFTFCQSLDRFRTKHDSINANELEAGEVTAEEVDDPDTKDKTGKHGEQTCNAYRKKTDFRIYA